MAKYPILTKKDVDKIISFKKINLNKKNNHKTPFPGHLSFLMSLDLGLTKELIEIKTQEFVIIRNNKIFFEEFNKIKENTFYAIINNKLFAIELFSNETNLYYKLKPTNDWPSLMLSSVPMHRFKSSTPKISAELMVKEISPINGIVLDCCAGLGYTSVIEANQPNCKEVISFEKDNNVLEIASYNPYSNDFFLNKKIKLYKESVFEGIKKFENNYFDRILHDPPTVSFAKELYSIHFYKELYRVLKKEGLLYHYCPNPKKTKGNEFFKIVEKLLKQAGFINVKYNPNSSGIRATKK